ncbi:hypothetical protein BOTBODRAFT_65084 [Botryobasidium botryosum FD-172 SS1]|uniref:Trafficking protein particle complex subunit 11 domain-containing protein n=1 Tax=Botryobasidium botryosum (strain FD-172 SS1) TaxID=930990 RepID=A0A067MK66_BOTB1|nr:hypothetical protein BOTBODRAFT_65084 [Botryobasidium botryosum FD-172 SS1]
MTPHAQVTYAGPAQLLSSDNWLLLRAALKRNLPLRNVHWKPASRPSIRTVQELSIDLVPFDSIREEQFSQIPTTLVEKPLLNIYMATCEDNETYKVLVRRQIKDWLTIATNRRNQEWLVVLLVRPDEKQASGKRLFQIKGSIIDKIRADINTGKRDRCVQLTWSPGVDDPTAWTDLISKMKEGIMSTFDAGVALREEEVKRSESQRTMPGWNFCTFFTLKESLASSFEAMNLLEDAQIQYDELEATFLQVLKENATSPFTYLGGDSPFDDSAPLLSITKKPYRDLILTNSISLFDFRIYLLARQCSVLGKMGYITRAAKKAEWFINTFSKTLRQNESSLGEYFIESWMYSAALSTVEQCQGWVTHFDLDRASLSAFNAAKGELLRLSRTQLEKIGIRVGHVPSVPPFSMSLSSGGLVSPSDTPPSGVTPAHSRAPSSSLTCEDLIEAISSRDSFDELYIMLTHRAIESYTASGRRRFALMLHASLAALDSIRSRHSTALVTFGSLPAHYVGSRWAALEGFMLAEGLDCHERLAKVKDREWVSIALAFLKAYVGASQEAQPSILTATATGAAERLEYLGKLVHDLENACATLEADFPITNHPMFSIKMIQGNVRRAQNEDGVYIDAIVSNQLPCDVQADRVSVSATGLENMRVQFTSSPTVLRKGSTKVELYCPTPAFGTFLLEQTEIRRAKLLFHWPQPKVTPSTISQSAILVKIPEDRSALKVGIGLPNSIQLGSTPQILVTLSTGRNRVTKAILKLSNATNQIEFHVSDGQLTDGAVESVHTSEREVVLEEVDENSTISITVPYSGSLEGITVPITVDVEYSTESGGSLSRKLRRTEQITGSLPLAVNVQDYFRGKRLFSRFTVSSDGRNYLKVLSANLEGGSSAVRISSCRSQSRARALILTPSRSTNFLFQMDLAESQSRKDTPSMRLVITYQTLRREVQIRAARLLREATAQKPQLTDHIHWLSEAWSDALGDEADWYETYETLGVLCCRPSSWNDVIEDEKGRPENEDAGAIRAKDDFIWALEFISEKMKHAETFAEVGLEEQDWRVLTLPVDLPFMDILNAARLRIDVPPTTPMFAGQPLQAVLSITTSLHWRSATSAANTNMDEGVRKYRMQFDVSAEQNGDWLVSGPKRGEFVALDDYTHTVRLTLVPLRHGALALPTVSVSPVPDANVVIEGAGGGGGYIELPSCETHQVHAAERIEILPRSARATYVVNLLRHAPEGQNLMAS